ncbi:MAG: DeoR/GlpR family DNA-binding transcription regulator [Bacteroidota bacterium]|nr:DeoR/GlpR family DNA-binding transcription regulator [Bacteroidota bacterium]
MTQGQRHRSILEYLDSKGELIVDVACNLFNASPATIRRDFNQLVNDQLAEKTWGGIIKKMESGNAGNSMLPLSYRQEQFVEEKKKIAEKAASLIEDGDVVMIDGGTTTFFMAPFLANRHIRIITNSIIIAYQIDKDKTEKQGAEVFLTGGMLYPESGLLVGPQTNSSIKTYHAKWAFLSAGAVDENGPSNSNQLVVESEQAMIHQSTKTVLLADHSKFDKRNMCSLCNWEDIDQVITNYSGKLYSKLKGKLHKV